MKRHIAFCRVSQGVAKCLIALSLSAWLFLLAGLPLAAQGQSSAAASATVQLGTVKSVTDASLVFNTDAGAEVSVQFAAGTRILRVAPGEKDLSHAVVIKPSDLLPGDRVRVRASLGEDGKTRIAVSIIVMKKEEIASTHQQELQDWQRRGIGGPVKSVDVPGGAVVISSLGATGPKDVKVLVGKQTILRRYAINSVRFDDAKLAPLEEIKPGDQLRARGTRSADGTEFTAEEIVSGTFRNLSGLITAIDSSANTLTLQDLATKKPVTVLITPESQLKKLPAMLAMMIAARLKGVSPAGQPLPAGGGAPPQGARPGGMGGNGQRGGDFQQLMSRLPAASLADLQKGDAVMIVATMGSENLKPTAITLLDGVEALLTAAGAQSVLSPWTLSSPPEGMSPQ